VTAAHEDRILDTLKAAPKDGLSGDELGKATGLWSERCRQWQSSGTEPASVCCA
jgi:hypothetical protein